VAVTVCSKHIGIAANALHWFAAKADSLHWLQDKSDVNSSSFNVLKFGRF